MDLVVISWQLVMKKEKQLCMSQEQVENRNAGQDIANLQSQS